MRLTDVIPRRAADHMGCPVSESGLPRSTFPNPPCPHRHRVLLTVLSIPVVLVLLVLGIMPRASPLDPRYGASKAADASTQQAKFSVVIDAGSTGSRVHIFKFLTSAAGAQDLQFDKFEQLKPGLSSYAADPKAAAASLKPLLALALETIPEALHAQTHVSVGATAGLRMLPGTKADEILAEVRALLKTYPFQVGWFRGWQGLRGQSAERRRGGWWWW